LIFGWTVIRVDPCYDSFILSISLTVFAQKATRL